MQSETQGIRLPPLAVAAGKDGSGRTWRQSGTISGSLELARRDFRACLHAQGWKTDKAIPMGKSRERRMEISAWTKGKRRILLTLWQKGLAECGFAWGEEK